MGVVNLFGDMTYEGGAAMNGQFMAMLGASAAAVSITAGWESSSAMRFARFPDTSRIELDAIGLSPLSAMAINLLAVSAMALTGSWQLAGTPPLNRVIAVNGECRCRCNARALILIALAKNDRSGRRDPLPRDQFGNQIANFIGAGGLHHVRVEARRLRLTTVIVAAITAERDEDH